MTQEQIEERISELRKQSVLIAMELQQLQEQCNHRKFYYGDGDGPYGFCMICDKYLSAEELNEISDN
jgi:hypothetical protein